MVRSPVTGAVFFAEPVSEQVVSNLTANLFERIVKEKRYDLISPGQAKGVYSSLRLSDVVQPEIEIIQNLVIIERFAKIYNLYHSSLRSLLRKSPLF